MTPDAAALELAEDCSTLMTVLGVELDEADEDATTVEVEVSTTSVVTVPAGIVVVCAEILGSVRAVRRRRGRTWREDGRR